MLFRSLYFFGGDAIMASSQDLLRNALRALLDTASPTLLDVLRLIEDEVFRRRVIPSPDNSDSCCFRAIPSANFS